MKNNGLTKKIIIISSIFGVICTLICLCVELILKNYHFNYTISYIIGNLISTLCFLITSLAINKVTTSYEKIKLILVGTNILKLLICGTILTLVLLSPLEYGIFTCFFGLLSVKISIYITYKVIEPIADKRRTIDHLKISNELKNKIKANNIFKVNDLITYSRKELMFLEDSEFELLKNVLKEYELNFKGEVEVIGYDDESCPNDI